MRGQTQQAKTLLARLMDCSEMRLAEAAQLEEGYTQQAAERVLESPGIYRDWEVVHGHFMGRIAGESRADRQIQGIKRMALSLVHRKAPFEYLRDKNICGADRHRFFDLMFGEGDFARAMVREHRTYLTSFSSYICVDQFCAPASLDAIHDYERAYTSYWQAHANYRLDPRGKTDLGRDISLLQYLRDDLELARRKVLDVSPTKADELTMEELRRPTGDTVRMRAPRALRDDFRLRRRARTD